MTEHRPGRRRFLRNTLLAAGAATLPLGCGEETPPVAAPTAPAEPAPSTHALVAPTSSAELPEGLDPADFLVHGTSPLNLEMRRDRFGTSFITPSERMFVRANLPLPPEIGDRNDWELEVQGVDRPGALTLRELRTLGIETVTCVVQCSGNGRRFFEHGPSGSPWGVGAAANVVFTGCPLSVVVEHFGGVVEGARFLTATGGDPLPDDIEESLVVVERSVPRQKALEHALLAWEMNGEPLMRSRGAPLRLVVPGYYGVNHIKYVKGIAFSEAPSDAKIMRSGYRLRPQGQSGAADQPSMWAMNVKSWITSPPRHHVRPGRVLVVGVAFSGEAAIEAVDVSVDGGATWQEARLFGPDAGPFAWRQFVYAFEAPEGIHVLSSRARDRAGNLQPEVRVDNHRGYGNNSWRDMSVSLVVSADAPLTEVEAETAAVARGPIELSEAGTRGREIFLENTQPACGACHALDEAGVEAIVGPDLDALRPTSARVAAAVRDGVGIMPPQQGLTAEQIQDLATYVAEASGGS